MKFSAAVSIILATSHGSQAFVAPFTTSRTASTLRASADPYESMLDAISSAADAASTAAQTSAQLASSFPHSSTGADALSLSSLMTPEAISAAQAKLSVLESNFATSNDPSVMTKAIMDALDASINYAEHAASSTSVLTSNLANFDAVLSNSMAMHSFHLMPPESAEVAQANLAQLIHNLSGLSVDDAFLTNFLADVDRKLDALTAGSNVSASTVMLYGTAAFMLAYSQRQAGVKGYKKELKQMIEGGEFDINVLAEDVGLEAAIETIKEEAKQQLEDPTIAMAAIENPKPLVPVNVAAPKPPTEAIPMKTLMKTVAKEELVEEVEPEPVMVVDFSKSEVVKVTAPKKRKALAPPTLLSSPLARLLADELGLNLANIGKGSGKNGKILIDDVRQFQAAKDSMVNNMGNAYFATVSA